MIREIRWTVVLSAVLMMSAMAFADPAQNDVDKRRLEIYAAWHKLPVPPITPYTGPFGSEARAFVGKLDPNSQINKDYFDWKRLGTDAAEADPRRVNEEFEKAMLDDWTRMGYNASYKGNFWTYRVGRWLKKHGMLGAIDQTIWAANGEPALAFDGTPGKRYGDGSGSFFLRTNYDLGVETLSNLARNHGELDLLKVGDYYITSAWDEVGMRERSMIDYRPEAIAEYKRYLKEVWFRDETPGEDTNHDGRTYNAFTGENLKGWDEVLPPTLSPRFYESPQPVDQKWERTGAYKLWMDFHQYYTFEYFRRVNADASIKAGKNIDCYPFPQAFIIWPGMGCFWGMNPYWNSRINPIVTVEQCWPDCPAMPLNYAITDRLARQYRNVVMGWSWFYFGDEAGDLYDGPGDIERALARMMGHQVDGIHHWLYSPQYRSRHQPQRLQLAYWHNFLSKHYASFLSKSAPPVPEVALMLPNYTGCFYRIFTYPKMNFAYTAAALLEAHVPFDVVCEEDIELNPDSLKPYKLLYVVGSEWTTLAIQQRVTDFVAKGGFVSADCDSLSLDIPTGQRTDFLEKTFGIRITEKRKNPFYPSTQTAEEEAWAAPLTAWGAPMSFQGNDLHKPGKLSKLWKREGDKIVRNEDEWKKLDEIMATMPAVGRGDLKQTAIDMRTPPQVRYDPKLGPKENLTAFGQVDTGSAIGGTPIAWFGEDVCGVETKQTVWLGTSPGMSLHAIAPRLSLSRPTEPGNPFLTDVSNDYSTHRPYVDLVAYAARKAGVKPIVSMKLNGQVPCNLEVLPRIDEKGNMMVFVINHDGTDATYKVAVDADYVKDKLPAKSTAWNLLKAQLIEKETDGQFDLAVSPHRVAVFFVGSDDALAPVRDAQARLDAMDLSVPQYFKDRPELNKPPYETPIPEK